MAAIAVTAGIAAWRPWVAQAGRERSRTAPTQDPAAVIQAAAATTGNGATSLQAASVPAAHRTTKGPATVASLRWGSGDGQLGHKRPQEGNPEGPMSLAVGPGGETVVVDQVNGRLLRMAPDGSPRASIPIGEGAQDVAVGQNGTMAVLDRLVDRDVTVYSAGGKAIGTLPVEGTGIGEPGQVTGVFVDGNDVYVEREHGQLVLIGDTSGRSSSARTEIPGRPSRDGSSYVSAGIDFGRVYLTAITREGERLRYTRPLPANGDVEGILLLDTDRMGTVYIATLGTQSDGTSGEWLTCASLADGHVMAAVPVNENTLPEETFREFAVMDDGGVLHEEMTDSGVAYVRYDCF